MASAVSRDSCSVCAEVAFGLVPTVWEMTGQYLPGEEKHPPF
jgi:hypothetical protein